MFSFSRASRVTHFRVRRMRGKCRQKKQNAKEAKEKKTKIKINKREIKFLLLPLGTFLISCVFCQDKLNFYERLRLRLVSSLLVAKQSQEASSPNPATASATAAATSENFKLFSSSEIHFITSNYFVNIYGMADNAADVPTRSYVDCTRSPSLLAL